MDWRGAKVQNSYETVTVYQARDDYGLGQEQYNDSKLLPKYAIKCPFLRRALEMCLLLI